MGLLYAIFVMVGIVVLPLAMFLGIVGLAVLIWSWGRIGRYFINLGRWLGDWRNFFPLSVLGTLSMVILLLLTLYVLPRLAILWLAMLIIQAIVTLICLIFATIAWTLWFCQWFWPKYKRWLFGTLARLFGQTRDTKPRRSGVRVGDRAKPTATPTDRQRPKRHSVFGSFWALMLGKSAQPAEPSGSIGAEPSATVQPPKKKVTITSWFGSFWALMLGKPSGSTKPRPKPAEVQTTEQSVSPSGSATVTARTEASISEPPRRTALRGRRAKRSWLGSLWALMQGKTSKPSQRKAQSEEAKTVGRTDRSTQTTVAADAKTGATTPVTAPKSGEKPVKRGFFARMWNSIVRGITFVVGPVISGVLWVVQKVREGIEWIRVRLNLD